MSFDACERRILMHSSLRGSDVLGAMFFDEGLLFLLFLAEQGHEGGFAEAFAEAELEDDAVAHGCAYF